MWYFLNDVNVKYLVGNPFVLVTASWLGVMEAWICLMLSALLWGWVPLNFLRFRLMDIKPGFGSSGSMGRGQLLLEDEICISIHTRSRRNHEVLQNVLVDCWGDLRLKKAEVTNTCTPNHDWLDIPNLTSCCLGSVPPPHLTLIPKCKALYNHQKRTLDHSPFLLDPEGTRQV